MRRVIQHIPNTITSLNLFSGCVACVLAANGELEWATVAIIAAAVFDFFDGFAARLLKAYSPMGKELDSLADVVSFGVAPSYLLYMFFQTWSSGTCVCLEYFPFVAFFIAVFSAIRLAKFNIDTRQTTSFIGLPVPANALFWSALVIGGGEWLTSLPFREPLILALIAFSSWIMVSEVPMFALKFKNFGWKDNKLRFSFVVLAVAMIAIFKVPGISLTIVLYVLLSILDNRVLSSNK